MPSSTSPEVETTKKDRKSKTKDTDISIVTSSKEVSDGNLEGEVESSRSPNENDSGTVNTDHDLPPSLFPSTIQLAGFKAKVQPVKDLSLVSAGDLIPQSNPKDSQSNAIDVVPAWLESLDGNEGVERSTLYELLREFGSLHQAHQEMEHLRSSIIALRMRERRFDIEPLLRRRRIEDCDPTFLHVLVVALQNELGVYRDAAAAANLAEHPLVQTLVPNFTASSSRDLDKLVASGFIAGTAASGDGPKNGVDEEGPGQGGEGGNKNSSSSAGNRGKLVNEQDGMGGEGDGVRDESNRSNGGASRPDSKWSLERKLLRGQVRRLSSALRALKVRVVQQQQQQHRSQSHHHHHHHHQDQPHHHHQQQQQQLGGVEGSTSSRNSSSSSSSSSIAVGALLDALDCHVPGAGSGNAAAGQLASQLAVQLSATEASLVRREEALIEQMEVEKKQQANKQLLLQQNLRLSHLVLSLLHHSNPELARQLDEGTPFRLPLAPPTPPLTLDVGNAPAAAAAAAADTAVSCFVCGNKPSGVGRGRSSSRARSNSGSRNSSSSPTRGRSSTSPPPRRPPFFTSSSSSSCSPSREGAGAAGESGGGAGEGEGSGGEGLYDPAAAAADGELGGGETAISVPLWELYPNRLWLVRLRVLWETFADGGGGGGGGGDWGGFTRGASRDAAGVGAKPSDADRSPVEGGVSRGAGAAA